MINPVQTPFQNKHVATIMLFHNSKLYKALLLFGNICPSNYLCHYFKNQKVQCGKKSQMAFHPLLFCTVLATYTSSTLKSKKALLIKQQKLTKSKFSTLCQIPFRCFIFVQKNGELAFLHLKAGSEHCIPGRVRGKPYIKRKKS